MMMLSIRRSTLNESSVWLSVMMIIRINIRKPIKLAGVTKSHPLALETNDKKQNRIVTLKQGS